MTGWIKLYRDLLDNPLWQYSTPEQKTVLITLLLMASHGEKEWIWKGKKYAVKPGQFITSLESIVKKCGKGVSIQKVRTALKLFKNLDFITDESTKQSRLITIVNWGVYQVSDVENNNQNNSQLTDNKQTPNKQLTTIKNDNKENNVENNISTPETGVSVVSPDKIDWELLVKFFNSVTGKKSRVVTDKAKKQFNNLLKSYNKEEIKEAIKNGANDPHHKDSNHKWFTLEFISKPDVFDRYVSQKPKKKSPCPTPYD